MRLITPSNPPLVDPVAARDFLVELPVAYAPAEAVLRLPRGIERRTAIASHLADAERQALDAVSGSLGTLRDQGILAGWRLLPHTGVLKVTAMQGREQAALQALDAIEQLGDVVASADALATTAPLPVPAPQRPLVPAPPTPWQLDSIHAQAAWASGARGQGMTIGFVDSGALASHSELAGRQRGGGTSDARPWMDLLDGTAAAYDPYGHGTAVTSVAVGATTGSAPDAHFITARVFGQAPGGHNGSLASKLEGIGWMLAPTLPDGTAADPAAAPDIVNTSFGESGERMGIFRTALRALEDAGVMVVAAAGNTGRNGADSVLAPARYDSVLAVGMTDRDDHVDDGSAHSSKSLPSGLGKPDLVVPGVDVRAGTTDGEGGYSASSGTSLASAVAAGAAAVVWSAAPKLLPAQVRDVLRRSARDIGDPGFDAHAGAGLVDLEAAVRLARSIEQSAA